MAALGFNSRSVTPECACLHLTSAIFVLTPPPLRPVRCGRTVVSTARAALWCANAVSLYPSLRLSALSLRSLCCCPVPVAEANGKDSDCRFEQLSISDGEVTLSLSVAQLQ